MNNNSLDKFILEVKKVWGPLSTDVVQNSKHLFGELVKAPSSEPWLADLINNPPEAKELYRDSERGFLLIAYSEKKDTYRIPHDHGSGWVIYGIQNGEMEMGTYIRNVDQKGKLQLVNRETYPMRAGDNKVYLPGDIHHTRCLSESVLVLRFTSCDFKKEDEEGRMIRYQDYEQNPACSMLGCSLARPCSFCQERGNR
tara:strand:- start:8312 stop:8905 length:594 start_codon:yes stop_codon:yes gene_type:complete